MSVCMYISIYSSGGFSWSRMHEINDMTTRQSRALGFPLHATNSSKPLVFLWATYSCI